MIKRAVAAAAAAAIGFTAAAFAATPGTYEGWLFDSSGDRIRSTFTKVIVRGDAGDRFTLSTWNLPLTCPYLDRNGDPARARMRLIHRGVVDGARIDDTREFEDTHLVRVRGRFVGRRFSGRVSVYPQPRVTGACSGSVRVRARR